METALLLHRGGATIRGSEQCFIENAGALKSAGFRVLVVRNDPCIDGALSSIVDEIIPFEYPELMVHGFRPTLPVVSYLQRLAQLRSIIRSSEASVLLANGGLPCQLAVPAGRLAGIPIVCQFHHPATRRYLYLWMVNRVDQLIFPSEFTRSVVRARVGRDGAVIYNGVDNVRFRPAEVRDLSLRRSLGIPDDALVFGQVAALIPHKRQRLLIEAFAKVLPGLREAHLVLVGSGTDREALERQVDTLGISRHVHFAGYVDSTLPFFQHVIDVNVLASAEEGLGISVLEGAAVGLPAIVADATGLREAVKENQTALVFKVDDELALSACLVRIANDGELRKRLGAEARQFVMQKFSLDGYRLGIAEVVKRAIEKNT